MSELFVSLGAGLLALYFLPVLVARLREVDGLGHLFFLNWMAGWTIIGWFWVLYMALTDPSKDEISQR